MVGSLCRKFHRRVPSLGNVGPGDEDKGERKSADNEFAQGVRVVAAIKEETVTPEEVFVGMTTQEWSVNLCRLIVRWRDWVTRTLRANGRYNDFCERMKGWREAFLGPEQRSDEETARALFDICEDFGLIRLMVTEGLLPAQRLRSPVLGPAKTIKTRGASCGRPGAVPEAFMRVAKLFTTE